MGKNYKIARGSVQETLLIPLYGRKMAMDLYFSVEDEQDLQQWSKNFASVMRKGYMTGYRPLDKRYGFIANTIFKFGDKSNMCQVIEIEFRR